jgi:ABC-type transport system involved in multi-copper enzyme maturation permease subunit
MDEKGRALSETVWTRLDRKAGAIVELTIRQLRHRISTWVVFGVGMLLMVMLLAFYIDSIRDDFDSIDNDGDSEDPDGDGYPIGQENKYGTDNYNKFSYPGYPHFIFENDIDWNDQPRTHTGNHTWVNVVGYFTPTWINYDPPIWDQWSETVAWNDVEVCSDENSDFDSNLRWGTACKFDNGTYQMYGIGFIAEGTLEVPDGYSASWGRLTDYVEIDPDPASMYIDEDDIDWDFKLGTSSQGFDDDGDCLKIGWIDSQGNPIQENMDQNRNGIPCDVIWTVNDLGEIISISADSSVDEDPDDSKFLGESSHRTFIIGTGKIAFVMILGLFLPLFLALGLIRDETENGTLHYLLSKPIHRAEFILYRLLGYLTLVGTFVFIMVFMMSLVTSVIGPGDDLIRLGDFPVWLGIAFATILVLAAYGAVFNTLGLISPKYGVYICIIFGVWEFLMGLFTITIPNATIPVLSVSHWGIQMIDAVVLIVWPDTLQYQEMSSAFNLETGISFFWHPPVHTLQTGNPVVALIVSIVLLLVVTILMIGMSQAVFRNQEIM